MKAILKNEISFLKGRLILVPPLIELKVSDAGRGGLSIGDGSSGVGKTTYGFKMELGSPYMVHSPA